MSMYSFFRSMGRSSLMICIACALAAPAVAAPPSDESAEAREIRFKKAQAILDLATVKFREGRHAEALAELQQAEPLLEGNPAHPLVRFNIARCHEELGQLADAVRAYERYLDLSDADEARRARAATAAVQLRARAEGKLTVTCAAPAAKVTIAELAPEGRPCPVELDGVLAGSYAITVEAEGFQPDARTVEVVPGEGATVHVQSQPLVSDAPALAEPPPPEPSSGSWVPWALMGVGAATAVAGGVAHSGIEDNCVRTDFPDGSWQEDCEIVEVPAGIYAAYGVGGALIVAGVVWLLVDGEPSPQARVMPTGNGVLVRF